MDIIDSKIVKFIKRHHVMTLATVGGDGAPYCSNAFYSFDEARGVIVFAANEGALHVEQMAHSPMVAASIVLESKVIGKLQGVQITGQVRRGESSDRESYIAAFPYAAMMPLSLWCLEVEFIKLTDNRLGFGKKIIWRRE